jgi:tRNA(Ile)-lysidine synthetase-like protein
VEVLERIEANIRAGDLIVPGGEVLCLVSGGPDSTCLYVALRELGYGVSALHVNYGLRGCDSDDDARFCARELGAEIVEFDARGASEAELRAIRYAQAPERLRATGHTATDQVETILYRLVTSGNTKGIKAKREDGVVRPLLTLWREETEAFCRERGLLFRTDASNPDTVRGLIRGEILPLLERLHPAARANILRALDRRRTMPPALASLDLGGGLQAVREHDRLWLEHVPVALEGEVRWGQWRIRSTLPGLRVRGWRPGDRLAGRSKKVQDVFVDAKIPRSDREGWPLVVRGDEVVAVPGIVDAPGIEASRS